MHTRSAIRETGRRAAARARHEPRAVVSGHVRLAKHAGSGGDTELNWRSCKGDSGDDAKFDLALEMVETNAQLEGAIKVQHRLI